MIFYNLMLMTKQPIKFAPFYIREWMFTKDCDYLLDLKHERDEIEEFIGANSLIRLMSHEGSKMDNEKASQCMAHYRYEHLYKLRSSLNWSSLLYFHLFIQTKKI